MNQPALFAPRDRLQLEFERFDADNPEVWQLFCRFAREAIASGLKRFSADAIQHRIRWHVAIETRGGGGFKLNDHLTCFYARKFVRLFPEHRGFFETRQRRERATSG